MAGHHLTAAINFTGADQADRMVAGLPVAARLIRELAEAGFAAVWLIMPATKNLSPRSWREIRRLKGAMTVHIAQVPPAQVDITLAGDILIPAASLGHADHIGGAYIRLDRLSASALILKGTGKSSDGLVSQWLNRPISRRISALLLWLVPTMRPIHVTWFNAFLALVMFAALVFAGPTGLLVGALLFHACSVLDGVDGEMARATFRTSAFGATLDSAVDMATNLLFFVGALISLWISGSRGIVLLGAWGVVLIVIGSVIIARRGRGPSLSFDHVKQSYRDRFTGPIASKLVSAGTFLTSRDFFCLLGVVVVLGGVPEAIPYIIAILATGWIPFVLGSAPPKSTFVMGSKGDEPRGEVPNA